MSLGHASSQNHKAQLANAYNELGKELSSKKIRVVGNYNLGKVIGEGAYGKVRMGTHRITSARVAIKQIPKAMSSSLTREIHHHRQLHHPHVMQMYEVIATESSIWIVTELCAGGELYDFLAEKGRLSEDETRIFFGQLCLAVAYLHDKGIVHRDLKLENVLLDERCRIKLGDFGFTREYDRGAYLETFCGTTGYAAPEMLQNKRYTGPEVDVWSLGVIFYCLLTGTLPFDDDDESVMKKMIIKGEYEDPEWLSNNARDIIKNVLLVDPTKRLSIAQILSHSWFTTPHPHIHLERRPPSSTSNISPHRRSRHSSPHKAQAVATNPVDATSSSRTSSEEDVFPSVTSGSPPTTPDHRDPPDPFKELDDRSMIHSNSSESTLHNTTTTLKTPVNKRTTPVIEEEKGVDDATPRRQSINGSGSSKAPPYPVRTPARTKRRSVNSALSEPDSPNSEAPLTPLPPQDFTSLLKTPAPVIFSTPLERDLLNNLSSLGLDTGQIVHSVLSNACDAAGALWWMLKRKAEKVAFEELHAGGMAGIAETDGEFDVEEEREKSRKKLTARGLRNAGVQTDPTLNLPRSLTLSAPEFSFIPPTPTVVASPRLETSGKHVPFPKPMLSPPGSTGDLTPRTAPNTPSRDKDSSKGSRNGKQRSGSVSIMQRATTALEAAGLVRKKSHETVPFHRDGDHFSGEGSRSSHGSSSTRLVHSPSPSKLHEGRPPVTPSSDSREPPIPAAIGSPWVVAQPDDSPPHDRSPPDRDTLTSLPDFSSTRGNKTVGPRRNRASILSALRIWFNEDRKGKRKGMALQGSPGTIRGSPLMGPSPTNHHGRAGSGQYRTGRGTSRRSSSANSRRSSGASFRGHPGLTESPKGISDPLPSRRSFGAHTPTSERGDRPSRPSSVHSAMRTRHRKSPSAGSVGSYRAASPYHRRQGSGSSTRVVRQVHRPSHVRSNSTASSIHSVASSRPTSYYEPSETEGSRAGSPFRPSRSRTDNNSRRGTGYGTTFTAQKRQTPFGSPGTFHPHSVGRSSWKKSWGLEPPGWQNRTAFIPVEVLAISPAGPDGSLGLRDVFSGRMSMGDDSDWVDEDDDTPAFAGGLGQNGMTASPPKTSNMNEMSPSPAPPAMTLTLPLQTRRSKAGKRHGGAIVSAPVGRQSRTTSASDKASPPLESSSSDDGRSGNRWQAQHGRTGLASRSNPNPIQEEDEDEEEDA